MPRAAPRSRVKPLPVALGATGMSWGCDGGCSGDNESTGAYFGYVYE